MKKSEKYILDNFWEKFKLDLPKFKEITSLRNGVAKALDTKYNEKFWNAYESLPEISVDRLKLNEDCVSIITDSHINENQKIGLTDSLKALIPWRKGPFNFFGVEIDAEWKSNLKWDRVKDHIEISEKKVVDIGCNNSYYMYRMLDQNPEFVVGFDPMARYYYNYLYLDKYIKDERVKFELFGVDELSLFPNFFDTILFMGVLYHRREPLKTLKTINDSLVDDGQIIIESMGIPGDEAYCLFPEKTYTKSTGYWFLPTVKALENMLKRTNFCDIELIETHKLSTDEQRSTEWVKTESLENFLDPEDDSKTVEGYPAPIRIYMKARKNFNRQVHAYK